MIFHQILGYSLMINQFHDCNKCDMVLWKASILADRTDRATILGGLILLGKTICYCCDTTPFLAHRPLIQIFVTTHVGKIQKVFSQITGKTLVKSDMSDSAWLNVTTRYCTVSHLIAIKLAILPLDFGLTTCAILHI